MLISLDFDGTFTLATQVWFNFVRECQIRDHEIITVTHRRDTIANRQVIADAGVDWPVIFAYDKPKKFAAIEAGYAVDVWIDDAPHGIGVGDEYQPQTQSVFEIELRNAFNVLKTANDYTSGPHPIWQQRLITRLETVLGE